MRLPPALTAPVSALNPRQQRLFFWLTTAALGLILLWAAQIRAPWPLWPVADPDTWGYLHPALSKLTGGPFEHTYGRNFVYPGFLYLLLRATADFRAIPLAQHVLGLATGALLWIAWRQWRALFATSRLPAWADAALGLGGAAFFLRSASVLHFEVQIRPEAVFPFVAALHVCLLLGFLRAWYGAVRRPAGAALLAGASVFAAVLTYEIKPSFGFAMGVVMLPVLAALVFPWRQDWRARSRLGGLVAVGGLAALALLVLPERELARGDVVGSLFLPEVLLAVHAAPIRDQMDQDARSGVAVPFPAEWFATAVQRLDHEVDISKQPEHRPWRDLGINPDYLIFDKGSICRWLYDTRTPDQIAAFCFYYYRRTWVHRPGPMLGKVARQMTVFYNGRCPAFWPATKLKLERFYGKTLAAFDNPNCVVQMLGYTPSARYLAAADQLQDSTVVFRIPATVTRLNVLAAVGFLPLQILGLIGLGSVGFLPVARRRALWLPGGATLLLSAMLFANCLTVAVIHSLDGERYCLNLLVYALFCEVTAAVWIYEVAGAWIGSRSAPQPAAAAAPASVISFSPSTPAPAPRPTASDL